MKKISIILSILASMAITSTIFVKAQAQEIPSQNIPKVILDEIEQKVENNKNEIEEIKAWETDLNGNIKEVEPISHTFNSKKPPSDGYRYVFNAYFPGSARKNWNYKNLGSFRVRNTSSSVAKASYEQQSTTTSNWNVGANISAEATIGNSFLGGVTTKLGGSFGKSRTWTAGKKYGIAYDVKPNTTVLLTNYQVGGYSTGTLTWNKYHSSGANVGMYSETANGTAVSTSDVNIELTNVLSE